MSATSESPASGPVDPVDLPCFDPSLLHAPDALGRFVTWEWNLETAEVRWGGDVRALYGFPDIELTQLTDVITRIHPDDQRAVVDAMLKAVVDVAEFDCEFRAVWSDGSIHWLLARGSPAGPVGGMPNLLIGFTSDITPHKAIDEEILRERNVLEEVFCQAPAFIAVLGGPSHVFELINDEYRRMIPGREFIGKRVIDVVPEAQDQGFIDLLDGVYRTGVAHVEYSRRLKLARDPDDRTEVRYLDYVYQPRRDPNGRISGVIVLGVDRTERVQTEQKLIESEKLAAVGLLASSIAHEINNPLAAVSNHLYLAGTTDDLREIREYLAVANRELERVIELANQTLVFQKRTITPGETSLKVLVEGVLTLYAGQLRGAGVSVENRHRVRSPLICLEADVRQIAGNLIANAIGAMLQEGGRLLVRSTDLTDRLSGILRQRLTIADNGTGIAEALLSKVFEPFFTTKGSAGNGLGLWITQEIVKRNGWKIQIRSRISGPYRGTICCLTLPSTL